VLQKGEEGSASKSEFRYSTAHSSFEEKGRTLTEAEQTKNVFGNEIVERSRLDERSDFGGGKGDGGNAPKTQKKKTGGRGEKRRDRAEGGHETKKSMSRGGIGGETINQLQNVSVGGSDDERRDSRLSRGRECEKAPRGIMKGTKYPGSYQPGEDNQKDGGGSNKGTF